MSAQDEEKTNDAEQPAAPEATEEEQQQARQMDAAYEDRPTAVMPGSGGTIAGTVVNDWLDEQGNPKFGEPGKDPHEQDGSADDAAAREEPPD
jgi:hypothetical protein